MERLTNSKMLVNLRFGEIGFVPRNVEEPSGAQRIEETLSLLSFAFGVYRSCNS